MKKKENLIVWRLQESRLSKTLICFITEEEKEKNAEKIKFLEK